MPPPGAGGEQNYQEPRSPGGKKEEVTNPWDDKMGNNPPCDDGVLYVPMMTPMMPIRKEDAKPYGVSACVET